MVQSAHLFGHYREGPSFTGGINDLYLTGGALCAQKRVRTAVLFIVLTIITASMLSATAVSQAAQHEAGQIENRRSADSCWPVTCKAAC